MTIVQTDEREEGVTAMPDRRETASGLRDPRFWVSLVLAIITIATGFWTIARSVSTTQLAVERVAAMQQQLQGIDAKLNTIALDSNSKAKDIEFVKQQLADFRTDWKADKDIQDAWIANTREKIIKLEAQQR